MPKAKFKIPEIPKTFQSKEDREAVVKALEAEYHKAKDSVAKFRDQLNDSENHWNQVAAALSAARNTRVSTKKAAK